MTERGVRVCRKFTPCWNHLFGQVSKASVFCGIKGQIINLIDWLCYARKWEKSASTLAKAVKPGAGLHGFSSLLVPARSRIESLLLLTREMSVSVLAWSFLHFLPVGNHWLQQTSCLSVADPSTACSHKPSVDPIQASGVHSAKCAHLGFTYLIPGFVWGFLSRERAG